MNQRPPLPPQSPHLLDAEERALVRALPRLHGRSTPGPDLDASILAAAQAAVHPAKPKQASARPRVRWIAPAALAASMVLAVGMAWQLRPLPGMEAAKPAMQSDAAGALSVRAIESAPSGMPVPMEESKPAPATSVMSPSQQVTAPAIGVQHAATIPSDQPVYSPVPPVSAPNRLPTMPTPQPTPATMAMQAPPTVSPATTQDVQTSDSANRAPTTAAAASAGGNVMARDAAPATASKAAMATRSRPAAAQTPEAHNEAQMAADAGFVDDPGEDIPPATADSPAVRDAWMRRIGELLEQGKRQEAKASLAEFRRRYPSVALSPALHALEIEP